MNKDVIYIDVEDDITNIVSKIKDSKARIVALVPPKRVGILQSAVNMRLLNRAAENAEKRIVLITSDQALSGLAAAARIPVAKTLQSRPEIAEIPAIDIDDGDDVIDGSEIPVGELADKVTPKARNKADDAIDAAIAEDEKPTKPAKPAKPAGKGKPKVPDFNVFRKKLVLIGGGIVLFVLFMVWAIWFAPHATVVITAKTTTSTVDKSVTLKQDGKVDAANNTIKSLRQEQKKEISVDFTPTGKKKVGEKASGTMHLVRTSVSSLTLTIPAGTSFSSGDYTFVSTEPASLSGTSIGPGGVIQSVATVKVQATQVGSEYNLSSRSYSSNVSGFSAAGTAMSGGSSREVTVVSADDVAKAKVKLDAQKDASLQSAVKALFPSSSIVINESYQEARSNPTPSVAVDHEASGTVQLKTTVTASMQGIDRSDMKQFLEDTLKKEIGSKKNQKIYNDGSNEVKFAQYSERNNAVQVRLTANAKIGPEIDEHKVKEQVKGRNYGDVQSSLESIEGVQDVDTKFSPFWVRTVPNNDKHISIEFKLDNGR
ncbi:hypothetical protein V4210_03205 [Candidatus Nanosynbacter sp. BB002]|uniref:hypothetical protein n=1 Tax=Candidatus Nanosynbacter sp. BB002 TaxID=3393757 RepID=UPI0030D4924B